MKTKDLAEDPLWNLQEMDTIAIPSLKRVYFSQLLQKGLVGVMHLLDLTTEDELTESDEVVGTFTRLLCRIFLFGFKGDNYMCLNKMVASASEKMPKFKKLIVAISKLRPNASQAAGRFFGFLLLLLNANWILDMISLFHIVDFVSVWYEEWSFLGQEKYLVMFETIGERLKVLKFNFQAYECSGSTFDQVHMRRDKDGIIRRCLPTYNLWLDGKPRSAEENRRIFGSVSPRSCGLNLLHEMKEEEKSSTCTKSSDYTSMEHTSHSDGSSLQHAEENHICPTPSQQLLEKTSQVSHPIKDPNPFRDAEEFKPRIERKPFWLSDQIKPDQPDTKDRSLVLHENSNAAIRKNCYLSLSSDNPAKTTFFRPDPNRISSEGQNIEPIDGNATSHEPCHSDSVDDITNKPWPLAEDDNLGTIDSSLQLHLENASLENDGQTPANFFDSTFLKHSKSEKSHAKVANLKETTFSDFNLVKPRRQVSDQRLTSLLDDSGVFQLSWSGANPNTSSLFSYRPNKDMSPEPIVFLPPQECSEMKIDGLELPESIKSPTCQVVDWKTSHAEEQSGAENRNMSFKQKHAQHSGKNPEIHPEDQYMLPRGKIKEKSKRNDGIKVQATATYKNSNRHLDLPILSAPNRLPSEFNLLHSAPNACVQSLPKSTILSNTKPHCKEIKIHESQNFIADLVLKEEDDSSLSSLYNEELDQKEEIGRPDVFSAGSYYIPVSVKKSLAGGTYSEKNWWLCWQEPFLHDTVLPYAMRILQYEFCPKLLNESRSAYLKIPTTKFSGWLLKRGSFTKTYKRRYFICNLDEDSMLTYWKTSEVLKSPEGVIDLKEIINVSSSPGPRMERRSTRVLEFRESDYSSRQAVQITIHTKSKVFQFQADEYAAELLNIFNTAILQNEDRWGKNNQFKERWNGCRKSISGYLLKKGRTNSRWRLRYCVFDDPETSLPFIKYWSSPKVNKPKGMINLEKALYVGPCLNSDVMICHPYAFEIFEEKRVWTLSCNNRDQFKVWTDAIITVVKRYRKERCDCRLSFIPADIFKAGYLRRRTSSSALNSKKLGTYSWKRQYIVLTGKELWFCNGINQYNKLHRLHILKLDAGIPKFGIGEGFLQIVGIKDVRRLVGHFYGKDGVIAIKGLERAVFLHASDENILNDWISVITNAARCEQTIVPASPEIFST